MCTPQWAARGVDFSVAFVYGSAFVCIQHLSAGVKSPPFGQLFRSCLAFVSFLPWMIPPRRRLKSPDVANSYGTLSMGGSGDSVHNTQWELSRSRLHHWSSIKWGAMGGIPLCIGLACQCLALERESPNKVSLWCNLYVVIIPLAEGLMQKAVPLRYWAATVCSLAGVYCFDLETVDLIWGFIPAFSLGTFYAFLQALFFAMSYLVVSEGMTRYPSFALSFTAGSLLGCVIGSVAWVLADFVVAWFTSGFAKAAGAVGDSFEALGDWMVLVNLFWTGIVTFAFTACAENWALGRLSAVEHTVIIATTPVWNGLFAWAVNGTPVTLRYIVGAGLSLLAVVICQTKTGQVQGSDGSEITPRRSQLLASAT